MDFTARQIADFLGGEISGDEQCKVSNISRIDDGKPGTLSFLANPLYTKFLYTTLSSIILVQKDFQPEKPINATLIKVDDPYLCFTRLLQLVQENTQSRKKGISGFSVLPESTHFTDKNEVYISDFVVFGEQVKVGKNVQIYPHTYIGDNSNIGDNTIVYPNVSVYPGTIIGNNCILHSGCVIGSDGFGFAPDDTGAYQKIPHTGNVILEDKVEIFANTTIARASVGSTIIREGTKIDNLVLVAHNCEIGKNTVIAGQSGFSGSTKIGDNCRIGGQVGISGHIKIGNNVSIAAQSGIAGDIEDNAKIMGSPAFDAKQYKKSFIHFKNFNNIVRRINDLENKIKQLLGN